MGSSRPTDRSLGETTFLPQWMKGKLDTRFDYTDSTFSPPADEPGFFYIRYPRQQQQQQQHNDETTPGGVKTEGFRPINEIFGHPATDAKSIDLSKHPLPCQPFINGKESEPKIIVANKPKVRPTANDDFNNSTTSECGRSIVHVATQIMSSKFTKTGSSDTNEESSIAQYQQDRRGSRSLPATPLASPTGTPDSSPKSRRRNRFFTGAFVPVEGLEGRKNGWLLNSILGQSRELASSTKIDEEDEFLNEPAMPARAISRKKSISSQNLTYVGDENKAPKIFLQPKPSELREMNFWSPTSM